MTVHVPAARHPFLDGKTKRMFIDGKWGDAASDKTFETINPSTGAALASVAEGDGEDINRAVTAARRAFNGPWSKFKPFERQNLLLRLADLVDRHFDELAALDTLDMGAPISRTTASRLRAIGMLRYYAGQATAIRGETIENSLPGHYVSFTVKDPVGVVGAIIPWNGPLTASIWKIGPVLATGCTVVLKPAEEAPRATSRNRGPRASARPGAGELVASLKMPRPSPTIDIIGDGPRRDRHPKRSCVVEGGLAAGSTDRRTCARRRLGAQWPRRRSDPFSRLVRRTFDDGAARDRLAAMSSLAQAGGPADTNSPRRCPDPLLALCRRRGYQRPVSWCR
ncbi:MAG: aldehyde dehydrogenase family protein [Rhizobiales bacterium]|nr:aldehyde dehydrogenase family protein [Hyphomicrobiales bacterium]